MIVRIFTAAVLLAALAAPAAAEVRAATAQGFEVGGTLEVKAAPDKLYAALLKPSLWWNGEHTYSRSAANLTLDPHPGGCFCEALPNGGGVQHMVVTYINPGQALRIKGAMGPLAGDGVEGALTFTLKPSGAGASLQYTYSAGGYFAKGATFWAPIVDSVVGEQASRLARYAETGSPEPSK